MRTSSIMFRCTMPVTVCSAKKKGLNTFCFDKGFHKAQTRSTLDCLLYVQ
jgi:hypothetical protein